jgi:hypothetical protein
MTRLLRASPSALGALHLDNAGVTTSALGDSIGFLFFRTVISYLRA